MFGSGTGLPDLMDLLNSFFTALGSFFKPAFIAVLRLLPEVGGDGYLPPLPSPPDGNSILILFWDTLSWCLPVQLALVISSFMTGFYLLTFCLFPFLRWLKVVK